MKNLAVIFLFLMSVPVLAQENIYVDAIKNCLGPNGGTYYPLKVKKNVTYELGITGGYAVFNKNDSAAMDNVGVMFVTPQRKMVIRVVEKGQKISVTTQGNLYFFFVDDALLN